MECKVRKSAEINDESRLLELQRLVQTLQQQNEQLVAAMGAKTADVVRQGTTVPAVEMPRDSGIDLSTSCSDDLEDEILDLDMPEDEESWLYTTTAAKSQGDVLSWLRKDINNLDPVSRRALAIKLEALLAKKNGGLLKSSATPNASLPTAAQTPTLASLLDAAWDEEGLLSIEPVLQDVDDLSLDVDPGTAIARRSTFRVTPGGVEGNTNGNAAGTNLSSATFRRSKKASPVVKVSVMAPKNVGQKQSGQQQQASPASSTCSVDDGNSATSGGGPPSRKTTLEALHSELNPDLHDIKLLASMQEEELRRCLQNLQQMSRRRRTSSGNQRDIEPSSVTSNPDTTGLSAKSADRYATYTRPKQHLVVKDANADYNGTGGAGPGGIPSNVVNRKAVSAAAQPQSEQLESNEDASISSQKVAGLQKSLPNLISGSKSEFNLPAPSCPIDTTSEKGSYGDIPSALNPSGRTQATTSSASRLPGPVSRLPTPARSRLPTPSKSGIPTPRSSHLAVGTPSAAKQRTNSKSPAPTPAGTRGRQQPSEDWKDGCF